MSSDHRIACGEASTTMQQQHNNNVTTTQQQKPETRSWNVKIECLLSRNLSTRNFLRSPHSVRGSFNNNATTTWHPHHDKFINLMHSVGGTSDIDVTLISQYCPRSVLRLHPQTPNRVPGQPRFQNGSKSNVSHKEIKCKIVLSFFWNFTPPNQMTPDEATRCHLASSGVVIWLHLAGSGFIWHYLASSGFRVNSNIDFFAIPPFALWDYFCRIVTSFISWEMHAHHSFTPYYDFVASHFTK